MNKAFDGLGINRSKIYIANIVKCRPPANRVPERDEADACLNYLRNQVILIKPKIIILLGSTALKNILGKDYGITSARGNWMEQKGILLIKKNYRFTKMDKSKRNFIYANMAPSSIIKR